ncbi:MAG TPA: NAD(P)/FAD-dependent oxidoreductase [Natronosporangium sp.]
MGKAGVVGVRKPRHAEIAGAGFSGLTTAVALRQRGWTVRVHEKSPELREFGAGIFLWENGLRVLETIGAYDDVMNGSLTPPFYETRVHNMTVSRESFGAIRWRTMTRPHLYRALLNAAEREGVEIETGSEVVAADPAGSLTVASGRTYTADLVVGADGVGSKVRDSIGFQMKREKSRDGITRLLVPRLKERLGTGPEWDNVIDFWNFAPRVLRILYVPASEELLYVAFMAPSDDEQGSRTPLDVALWSEHFPHLAPVIEAAGQQAGRYDRYQTTVLSTWSNGRVALVGDSAHGMCPALAQGAGCAMVNALGLAAALDETPEIPDALQTWEKRERPITDRCQERSAFYAATRSMSRGNQFTPTVLETAMYEPTGAAPRRNARIG